MSEHDSSPVWGMYVEWRNRAETAEQALEHAERALKNAEHDAMAYAGALGYPIPGDHDGLHSNGTTPQCGLCEPLRTRLGETEQKYEHDRGLFTQIVDDLFDGMECDASCDDYSHGETCPTTLGPEAVKRLRAQLLAAEQRGRALKAAFALAFKTMLHLPMCGCDHEQNDPACHVGILRAALQQTS